MPSRRSGRAAAKRAQRALESTPKTFEGFDDEDETMADVEQDEAELQPEPEDEGEDGEKEDESGAEDEAQDEDEESAKSPTPPPEPVIRRRRLGRPPKNRPPDWDSLPIERPSDADGTPRRRGRGGWRGRGGRKGQQSQPTQQSIDKDGTVMDIIDDEVDLPEDPEGETKVDKMGNLKDGREYRCRTFTLANRGDRLYMLSTEPARCVGFRDSYLFFTKHRKLYKIIVNDEEKRDMIERDIIPHSYKGRSIGIVTARSVFREFGALIIVGGRRIIDDYEVAKAREEGIVEGELADPNDRYEPDKPYNKNQYVAWFGASAVYHSSGPAMPQQNIKADPKKRRVAVNDINWQLEHAREASQFNSILSAVRRQNLNGVYDIHTNQIQYPAIIQPTHVRIVQVADTDEPKQPADPTTLFQPVKPAVSRNFLIMDTQLETPPAGIAPAAYDVPFRTSPADRALSMQADFLSPFKGLGAVSDDIRDLLPDECREAFDATRRKEDSWFANWGDEVTHACRREPVVDKAIVPYTMTLS
ncbi:chromatin remodelling complex Rsc7/Swp82 subunit-domain-containing protein [Lasiosphaeria miniovina]|uniref:Chromatin remodelling complex Rsc7/Swp82 subunit-domain-containing protein n=1 Tax=Lasiosphaeria miniovina TaxID=1954250 RepID=A0AA40E2R3_9PEZI|nr:chromatin remodelling complex Rsc7/Swp82 subunit-domain-containing protein [Lasiosphaeria miniovina]KAK0722016.1 chromatin remodelling complex Rsc7/Swp82 subunit-domain-containing protein [Lasiosphaeria miniovina]